MQNVNTVKPRYSVPACNVSTLLRGKQLLESEYSNKWKEGMLEKKEEGRGSGNEEEEEEEEGEIGFEK